MRQPRAFDPGNDCKGRHRAINASIDHVFEVSAACPGGQARAHFCRAMTVFRYHNHRVHRRRLPDLEPDQPAKPGRLVSTLMLLPQTSLFATLMLFALSAAVVWFSGARLAYLMDTLADRYHLAKSLVGLLILSLATSLPEVATTLTAAIQQTRDLVLNNLFGGIALQTAILAMSDFWARGAITNYPRKANHALEATLLVLLLSVALIITNLGETFVLAGVGLGSTFIALTYAIWKSRCAR